MHPKTNFDITWIQVPKTGLTATPSTTLTTTTKPIKACMQVTGPQWVLKPISRSLQPMSPRVFPCRFSLFQEKHFHPLITIWHQTPREDGKYISYVHLQDENYFPQFVNVAARVCRSPGPGYGQTIPKSSSCTHQHHLNVA
jgi:hypothetical protein